jgi:hypothetical protein
MGWVLVLKFKKVHCFYTLYEVLDLELWVWRGWRLFAIGGD